MIVNYNLHSHFQHAAKVNCNLIDRGLEFGHFMYVIKHNADLLRKYADISAAAPCPRTFQRIFVLRGVAKRHELLF